MIKRGEQNVEEGERWIVKRKGKRYEKREEEKERESEESRKDDIGTRGKSETRKGRTGCVSRMKEKAW